MDAENGRGALAEAALVVPPLNFAMVAPGVYRSGYPNKRNFPFLRRLGLKSILCVLPPCAADRQSTARVRRVC